MTHLYVDADACPVKDEVVRVAERHGLRVTLVSNRWHRLDHPLVDKVVVPTEPDAADHWIAEHIEDGDIAISNDVPLARRCVEKGAAVLTPTGKTLDGASIGMAVAVRDLMTHLRETGEITSGPSSYSKQDRSRFLDALERAVQAMLRRKV